MIALWGARGELSVLFFWVWKRKTEMYIHVPEKEYKGRDGEIEELTRPS